MSGLLCSLLSSLIGFLQLREEVQDEDDLPPRFEGSDLEDDPLLMSMLQGQEISETLLYDGARLSKVYHLICSSTRVPHPSL